MTDKIEETKTRKKFDDPELEEARRKHKNRYSAWYKKTKYSRVIVEIPPETKEVWVAAAKASGVSLQQYVRTCVESYIQQHQSTKE